ncbi:piggyBac transposable element-derived protein 4-like [Dreissena polymorpha]|uniref:piggyBac transposable element-derived protein 4-like n=1 Tax=Dreissena polymorpha TaxID=45954 RepID=UPI0022643DAD|nr:piggyBac transposable element-derived protein 4-like [Dreissena polymorpha]
MADYLDQLFDSDSDESEFSGFSEFDSDIEVGDLTNYDIIPDAEAADDNWTDDFSPLRFDEFNEQPGERLPDGFDVDTATPMDYFWLLFSPQLLQSIVGHTNGYFDWKMAQLDIPTDLRWQDTTEEEMRAFLAINILMGINQLPNAEMFWSSNPFINNAGITNTMKCNRFQKLVRPVMESVSRTFQDIYTLNKEVSIDEAMIAFTGRLSFRQYMPAKPIKRGIKVWMLCDARTAFLARFEVYLGPQNNQTEHGLGDNVVMRLVDHIYHFFGWLFFDNFFTGIPLMKELLEKGLYACGTVRVNRKGFLSQLKKPAEVRQRGDFKIMQMGDTNLTATVWQDTRLVHHLFTLRDPIVILPENRFTHLDFRLELVRELAEVFCKRKGAAPEGRGRDGLVEQMNMGGHVMFRLSDKTKACKYHT